MYLVLTNTCGETHVGKAQLLQGQSVAQSVLTVSTKRWKYSPPVDTMTPAPAGGSDNQASTQVTHISETQHCSTIIPETPLDQQSGPQSSQVSPSSSPPYDGGFPSSRQQTNPAATPLRNTSRPGQRRPYAPTPPACSFPSRAPSIRPRPRLRRPPSPSPCTTRTSRSTALPPTYRSPRRASSRPPGRGRVPAAGLLFRDHGRARLVAAVPGVRGQHRAEWGTAAGCGRGGGAGDASSPVLGDGRGFQMDGWGSGLF